MKFPLMKGPFLWSGMLAIASSPEASLPTSDLHNLFHLPCHQHSGPDLTSDFVPWNLLSRNLTSMSIEMWELWENLRLHNFKPWNWRPSKKPASRRYLTTGSCLFLVSFIHPPWRLRPNILTKRWSIVMLYPGRRFSRRSWTFQGDLSIFLWRTQRRIPLWCWRCYSVYSG
jgi:hypothetical protein